MTQPLKLNSQLSNQVVRESFDAYSEIELTEDETKAALLEARRVKYVQTKTAEYKKRLSSDAVYPKFTSYELYIKVKEAGFEIDDYNEEIIKNLCKYFVGDPNGLYDLRKGIMLYGPVGCYKTSLMKFFRHNQTNSFAVFHVMDLSAKYAKDGEDFFTRYRGLIKSTDESQTFGQSDIGICFDDFGTEVDKKHYGNESNVMAEIIQRRHMNHVNLMAKTHFTTNLATEAIEERYGVRVRSRLREMVNLVAFPDNSPDRRK